jgi:predicted GNAT superfamily acetyltransferase
MGVGRILYDHAAVDARQRGLESLCCEVNLIAPNEASMAFHKAMGFKTLGSMDVSGNRRIALLNCDF